MTDKILERAVRKAELELQKIYKEERERRKKAAEERYTQWLKHKGFKNQSPALLSRPVSSGEHWRDSEREMLMVK